MRTPLTGPAPDELEISVLGPGYGEALGRWPGLLRAPVLVIPCVRPGAYVERYAMPLARKDARQMALHAANQAAGRE